MAKDPAFLFYSQDFIIGTQFFTNEETGYYIRVMCAIHQHGRLTKDNIEALYGRMPERVFSKFKEDEKGYLFNERLEQEIERRKAFAESRRNNRKKKDENNTSETLVKDMNKTSKTLVKHMETENENENIDVNEDKGGVGEKEETLIPIMLNIFSSKNRSYVRDQDRDFPEMLKIIMFLNDGRLPTNKEGTVQKWKSIVDFISTHNFFRNYSIKQINTHIQNILQTKENANNTGANTKSSTGKQLIGETGFGKLRSH